MTCPAKHFGCSCRPGECQTPNHELIKTANVSITGPLLMIAFIAFVAVCALFTSVVATSETYPHLIQEQSR